MICISGEIKTATKSGETLHWKDTAEASSKYSKQQPSGKCTIIIYFFLEENVIFQIYNWYKINVMAN